MRYLKAVLTAIGVALVASVAWSQADNVKNYFNQCAGGSSTPCDNALNLDGKLQRKETVGGTSVELALMTTGLVALDGSNPTSVNMNPLATIDACTLTIVGADTPGDDPTQVTAVVTATAGQLNIYAWATNGADPTLVASTNGSRQIAYTCGGS